VIVIRDVRASGKINCVDATLMIRRSLEMASVHVVVTFTSILHNDNPTNPLKASRPLFVASCSKWERTLQHVGHKRVADSVDASFPISSVTSHPLHSPA